jgi:hypothetical protein
MNANTCGTNEKIKIEKLSINLVCIPVTLLKLNSKSEKMSINKVKRIETLMKAGRNLMEELPDLRTEKKIRSTANFPDARSRINAVKFLCSE